MKTPIANKTEPDNKVIWVAIDNYVRYECIQFILIEAHDTIFQL